MPKERLAGVWQQLTGKMSEVWGDWSGDMQRSADGRRDQHRGKARQARAIAQKQADRELEEFRRDHRNWFI